MHFYHERPILKAFQQYQSSLHSLTLSYTDVLAQSLPIWLEL